MSRYKWLASYIIQIRRPLVICVLFLFIAAACNIALTGIQKYLIDDIFTKNRFDLLWELLIAFAIAIIGYNFLHSFSNLLLLRLEYKMRAILTKDVMQYLHRIPTKIYNNERFAQYVHNMTYDVLVVCHILAYQIPSGLRLFGSTIVLMAIIGTANLYVLGTVLVFSVSYLFLGKVLGPKLNRNAEEISEKRVQMSISVEEGISSTREVLAFNRERWERDKLSDTFNSMFHQMIKQGKLQNLQMMISDPVKWASNIIVLCVGAYCVFHDYMSIGTFVVIYQFSSQLMNEIHGIFGYVMYINGNSASIHNVGNLLSGPAMTEGRFEIVKPIHQLRLENVDFSYAEDTPNILNGLSLTIPIGQKVAFVGTSGAGKSTIAQLLVKSYEPTKGNIVVNYTKLLEITRTSWSSMVSIVLQEPYFLPDKIENNLRMHREDVDFVKIIQACKAAEIHEFIVGLPEGYQTEVGERGIMLSGGQRQRLAIARSLISDPEILILDEATSALDYETERKVQANIDVLRNGKTTIIIAHRLSTIINADLIFVLEQGRVIESGTHQELLMQEGAYKNLLGEYHIA